jgi:hypothetical protein
LGKEERGEFPKGGLSYSLVKRGVRGFYTREGFLPLFGKEWPREIFMSVCGGDRLASSVMGLMRITN